MIIREIGGDFFKFLEKTWNQNNYREPEEEVEQLVKKMRFKINKMDTAFVTFGACPDEYKKVNDLTDLMRQTGFFNYYAALTDNFLRSSPEYWDEYNGVDGPYKEFGVYAVMQQLKDGDILVYSDCNNEIDTEKLEGLLESVKMSLIIESDGIYVYLVCEEVKNMVMAEWKKLNSIE